MDDIGSFGNFDHTQIFQNDLIQGNFDDESRVIPQVLSNPNENSKSNYFQHKMDYRMNTAMGDGLDVSGLNKLGQGDDYEEMWEPGIDSALLNSATASTASTDYNLNCQDNDINEQIGPCLKKKRTRTRGEALNILETEFLVNSNPSVDRRHELSSITNLSEKKIRVWFQNKRAKVKRSEKLSKTMSNEIEPSLTNDNYKSPKYIGSDLTVMYLDKIPFSANKLYCFFDVCSINIGTWKRWKMNCVSPHLLPKVSSLQNLSPKSMRLLMTNSTDLLFLFSKKNNELNYFFSSKVDNMDVIFRVFYPVTSVANCSLIFESTEWAGSDFERKKEEFATGNLQLNLAKAPNFAAYVMGSTQCEEKNQWAICEDFSENSVISEAHLKAKNIPHILTGSKESLILLNSLISKNNVFESSAVTPTFEIQKENRNSAMRDHLNYATKSADTTSSDSLSPTIYDNVNSIEILRNLSSEAGLDLMSNEALGRSNLQMNSSLDSSIKSVNTPLSLPTEFKHNSPLNFFDEHFDF